MQPQQPQKSSSVSSFSHLVNGSGPANMASTSSSFSTRGPQTTLLQNSPGSGHNVPQSLFGPSTSNSGSGGGFSSGLGHSSSSSILSQNSSGLTGSLNNDDKAYTQNALKQIRNSLQPFATKHPNGSGLDRRPSSASSNASSSNSVPVAGSVNSFGQLLLLQQGSLGTSGCPPNNGSSYLYNPPVQPTGAYQYGQVNKLATSASSTQISLNPMPSVLGQPNIFSNGLRPNCDTNQAAPVTRFDEHQRKLIKTLVELGLPEVCFNFNVF